MGNGCYTSRALPFLTSFSKKDRESAEKALAQSDERQRKTHESRSRKAEELVKRFRGQLQDLVGSKEFAELRAEIHRERLEFRELSEPPGGLDRDHVKQRKAARRRVDARCSKAGASPEKVSKIGAEFHEKLDEVLSTSDGKVVPGYNLPRNLKKWKSLSPLHALPWPWEVPDEVQDPTDPHRWFLFQPPFFGFLFRFAPQASSNFLVDRELFLQPPVGLVGNVGTMDCNDAGDFDYASVTAESQIAFGFEAPATGLVEVLIDAQPTISTHRIEIEDEFGWSNAWCHQNNYLMMNVLHPNVPEPSLALMSRLSRETDGDDVTANATNLTQGQHYFAQLFSSGPVPAGQHVVITVGTRTFDIARANDMELHSRSNFQWFINSVEVRISP